MKRRNKVVLSFDLDFTLIDNREGIINSFNYALKKYNLQQIDSLEIEKMIGTPLDNMFAKVTDLNPSLLISAFREYYGSKGIFEVRLLPGVRKKLKELGNTFIMGVITLKKQEMALKLLNYLELDYYFDYILGETDYIKSKTDLRLKTYLVKKYPNHNFVVIGDHPNDNELAEMLDCPFIGVLTGYHTDKQLRQDNNSQVLILNNINELTKDKINSLF
ncbi:MAG: HAD family hydrolase [Promethearchaeota archaeon]